jgi:hypothetical protein
VTITEARTRDCATVFVPAILTGRPPPLPFEITASTCSLGWLFAGMVTVVSKVPVPEVRTEGMEAADPSHASWSVVLADHPAPLTESAPPATATPVVWMYGSPALAAR